VTGFRPFFTPATGEWIEQATIAEDTGGEFARFSWRSVPGRPQRGLTATAQPRPWCRSSGAARAPAVPDRGNLRRGGEFGRNAAWRITGGAALITLLAPIAAVILAISGRYPQRIFDLVMGLNRWRYRVLAHAT